MKRINSVTLKVGYNSKHLYVLCDECKALKLLPHFDTRSGVLPLPTKCRACNPMRPEKARAPIKESIDAVLRRILSEREASKAAKAKPVKAAAPKKPFNPELTSYKNGVVGIKRGQKVAPDGRIWCNDCLEYLPKSAFNMHQGKPYIYCRAHQKERNQRYQKKYYAKLKEARAHIAANRP